MDPAQVLIAEAEKLQLPMNAVISKGDSPIQSWYSGSVAFITGGNGFLGKLLIEKLLRACNMNKIYILLRGKKNKTMMERLDLMIQDPIFDKLRETRPEEIFKIVPVEGDVAEARLGIKGSDWNTLIEEVDIVFHLAATTRFDECLRVATNVNVRGTREALAFGKACKKLRFFNYVSTAYTHATKDRINGEILEDFYDAPVAPNTLISMVETISDDRLNAITDKLIENWPNTYSFTKAVAEELVKEAGDVMPICVIRPAIVQCPYYEPTPGWCDNSVLFGAGGVLYGIGLGLLHIIYCEPEAQANFVPGDYVTNATIAAGWHTARRWAEGQRYIKIYTVSNNNCDFKYRSIHTIMHNNVMQLSSRKSLWYCYGTMPNNKVSFLILTWLLHLIPAYIVDGIFYVCGFKMPTGIKSFNGTYWKIYKMSVALSHFTLNEWNFRDTNTEELFKILTGEDQAIFNFDVPNLDWNQYLCILLLGIRKFVAKDGLVGTEAANKRQKIYRIANYIFFALYFYVLYKILYFIFWAFSSIFSVAVQNFGSII